MIVATVFTGVKFIPLRVFKHSAFKCNQFLNLFFSQISFKNCCKYSTEKNGCIFDNIQMQKYLNFLANEQSKDSQVVNLLKDKKNLEEEIKSLENMASDGDKEFEKMIESERKKYLESMEEIKKDLLNCLLVLNNENDDRNVELHIEHGIGGEESKLFSKELFQMYINYAGYKNWECTEFDNCTMLICGDSVFGYLKHEAGVHRVQRVPETEKNNRIHTSTCSVVVLPQPKSNEIQILNKDLIIEKLRSSGPGGQNVNKRESCIRIKHIPTGVTVECQSERYQFQNLKQGIDKLRGVLFNREQEKITKERNSLRKEQAGTHDYADKIRTYHYPQNRVTDHRLNYTTHDVRNFLEGNKELDWMINKIRNLNKEKELLSHIEQTLQSAEYKKYEKKSD